MFVQANCIRYLLSARITKGIKAKGLIQNFSNLIRQFVEDKYTIRTNFEVAIMNNLNTRERLSDISNKFNNQAHRSKELYLEAVKNVCNIYRQGNEYYIELKEEKQNSEVEKLQTMPQIICALTDIFTIERTEHTEIVMHSDQLISIIADILQIYPYMVNSVINQVFCYANPASSPQSKNFLTYFIRSMLPFRYTLQLNQESKISFSEPLTGETVPASIYTKWMTNACKFIKILCLKQTTRNLNQRASEYYMQEVLQNNMPVIKARKRVFREIRDVLTEISRKNWFKNIKYIAIVRSLSIVLMQLLREPANLPFSNTNTSEIAHSLISEKYNMVKILADCCKGITLQHNKAGSMLNLIYTPLELLTHYNITFTLRSGRQQTQEVNIIIEEGDPELDMKEYEIMMSESYQDDQGSEEQSQESDQDEDQIQFSEDEDDDDDLEEDSDDIEIDEDVYSQFEVDEYMNDSEISGDDYEEEDDQLLDVVLESRANDSFWVDDLEDENEIDGNWMLNGNRLFMQDERPISLAIIGQDHEDPTPVMQRINPRMQGRRRGGLLGEIQIQPGENAAQFNFTAALIPRGRRRSRSRSPPRIPNSDRNVSRASNTVERTADEINSMCQALAVVVPEEPPEAQKSPEAEEAPVQDSYQGIDPAFLDALPQDIRQEVLQQQVIGRDTLPPPQHDFNIDFSQMARLPNEPANPLAADMDNASFIATLAPDLRREVLMTATEEFLSTLPYELVAEAQVYQERAFQNQLAAEEARFIQERIYPFERPLIAGRNVQQERSADEEGKDIQDIVADDKLAGQLTPVDDSFLEVLLKSIYLLNPVNRDVFASLLLNISAVQNNRQKLLHGLISLLRTDSVNQDFPPMQLYGSDKLIDNYSQVNAIVAGRILDILQYLTSVNPKVSNEMQGTCKHKLHLIRHLKGLEERPGISSLIILLRKDLFKNSSTHLNALVNLLVSILDKCPAPELNQEEARLICELLHFPSLNDQTLKQVITIFEMMAQVTQNVGLLDRILVQQIQVVADQVCRLISSFETSANGLLEVQLLRLCKALNCLKSSGDYLQQIWVPLTELLNHINSNYSQLASVTTPTLSKLLPIIEAFFLNNDQANPIFNSFCEDNKKILNIMIKQNPNLLNTTFSTVISKYPQLLDFENKRTYFRNEVKKLKQNHAYDDIRLNIRRSEVFMDSYSQLKVRKAEEMHRKLRVQFTGEEGVDAGGLTREWYSILSREVFNPNYALFLPSANGTTFQPNSMSFCNSEHLEFFRFVGRFIGKALFDGYNLDVHFTRSFYKHILSQEVTFHDIEDIDPEYYKNLQKLLEMDVAQLGHDLFFAYEEEEFGCFVQKQLCDNGMNIKVTQENKHEYVTLLCQMKMTNNIRVQIDSFLEGFYEIIPKTLITIFDCMELELLISGLPDIDVTDLKANTEYHNYTKDSPVIKWLWEILHEFSQEERAEFLQFVTGSSKVPLDGFKALPGMGGVHKFQIHKSFSDTSRLPTAHTCMNQLDLPEYTSKEILYARLKLAISEGKEGFGFM